MTFRFRFAKPTEKRVQEIDLNSTFSKNVSGWWSAWNVRLVIFTFFYVLILPKWHKLDIAFCKAYGKKCVKRCKNHHFLRFESCKKLTFLVILDFSQSLRTSFFWSDFRKSLRRFLYFFSHFFPRRFTSLFESFFGVELGVERAAVALKRRTEKLKRRSQSNLSHFHAFGSLFYKNGVRNDARWISWRSRSFLTWFKTLILGDFDHRFQDLKKNPNSISLGGVAWTFPFSNP